MALPQFEIKKPKMKLPANINLPPIPPLKRWHKLAIAGVFGLFVLVWIALSLFVNEKTIASQFMAKIKEVTGYEATYGDISVSVLFTPEVTLTNVRINNAKNASTQQLMLADEVRVSVSLMELLSGRVQFTSIELDGPEIQLERFADGSTNWSFINSLASKDLQIKNGVDIKLKRGALTYVNAVTNQVQELANLSGMLATNGKSLDVGVGMVLDGKAVQMRGDFTVDLFVDIDNYQLTGKFIGKESQNNFSYIGKFGRDKGLATFDGKLESVFTDIKPWIFQLISEESRKVVEKSVPEALPLSFAAELKKAGPQFVASNMTVKATESEGLGAMTYASGDITQLALRLNFKKLDFGNLAADSSLLLKDGSFNTLFGMFLPANMAANIEIKAGETRIGGTVAESAQFSATLDQQELVVNQAALNLPNDNHLLLFGILKQAVNDQINFDGNVEVLGKSLNNMVDSLGLVSQTFITDHAGEFRGKANLFLSPNYNIISDIKFQAGPLVIVGGATIGTTKNSDAEITLKADNMKLDGMLSYLVPTSPKDLNAAGTLGTGFEDVDRKINWLDKVAHRIRINLVMPNYSLGERVGSNARFTVMLAPKSIEFTNSEISLDDLQVRGNLKYGQHKRVPDIKADFYLSYLNLTTLTDKKSRLAPVPRGNRQEIWNADYFNVNFLKGYNSLLKIQIGNLIHPDFGMTDVEILAQSTDDVWTVEELRGKLWEGALSASFTLDITSVPGINAQFALQSVKADRMLDGLLGQPSFRGLMSVNGQIQTTGLNLLSWVRNSVGHFSFTGQEFAIKGFDIASLVQTVPLMRSVTDVVNTARVALVRNQSTFNLIEGLFELNGGVLSTPQVKLRAKHATGTLTGNIDMMQGMMDLKVDFALITLEPTNFPSLDIFFKDSIDDPMITFDTRSLEAFIARKNIR